MARSMPGGGRQEHPLAASPSPYEAASRRAARRPRASTTRTPSCPTYARRPPTPRPASQLERATPAARRQATTAAARAEAATPLDGSGREHARCVLAATGHRGGRQWATSTGRSQQAVNDQQNQPCQQLQPGGKGAWKPRVAGRRRPPACGHARRTRSALRAPAGDWSGGSRRTAHLTVRRRHCRGPHWWPTGRRLTRAGAALRRAGSLPRR
jgi:hypothetical protein